MAETIIRQHAGPGYFISRIIWTLAWIVEALLALRLLLRALAANPASGFTHFIYNITLPLVNPFVGIVRSNVLGNHGVWEWFTVIAMIVYYLLAWAIDRLVSLATTPTYGRTIESG